MPEKSALELLREHKKELHSKRQTKLSVKQTKASKSSEEDISCEFLFAPDCVMLKDGRVEKCKDLPTSSKDNKGTETHSKGIRNEPTPSIESENGATATENSLDGQIATGRTSSTEDEPSSLKLEQKHPEHVHGSDKLSLKPSQRQSPSLRKIEQACPMPSGPSSPMLGRGLKTGAFMEFNRPSPKSTSMAKVPIWCVWCACT